MSWAFDRWIRESAPSPGREDAGARRRLWSRLEDRLHQRRQTRITRGAGLVAAAVVLGVLGFVDVRPLGSNNWSLIPSGREGHVEDAFTGQLYPTNRTDADGLIAGTEPRDFWERVREQRAAGSCTLEAIDFFEIGDEINWMLFYRHWIGEESRATSGAIDRENTMGRDTGLWLLPHLEILEQDLSHGVYREVPARIYRVNGRDFWFRVWFKQTDRGALFYGTAVIPDDLK